MNEAEAIMLSFGLTLQQIIDVVSITKILKSILNEVLQNVFDFFFTHSDPKDFTPRRAQRIFVIGILERKQIL